MKLPWALRATFLAALAVVVGTAILSYRNSKLLLEESAWVIHTHEVREVLARLLSSLEAAETAERGFIITGDETYLAPHNATQREVPEDLRHLHALIGDNAEQDWRFKGLEPHVQSLLQWLRETVETRRHEGVGATTQRLKSGTGTVEMESVRERIHDMDAAENRLLQERAEAVSDAARATAATFGLTTLFVVALIGLLYWAVNHHLTVREEAERARDELLSKEQGARRAAEEAHRQLEQADRAKDAFLATVSHELRTPLSPILTWAEVLKRGGLDEPQSRRAVEAIQRSAKVQAQLIEDLLDVSRIVAGQMRLEVRPVNLPDVLRAAVDVVRPAADAKAIRLRSVLDTETAPVSGDPDRLQQVVWNLLSNAVKFTPKGGRVTVVLERVNSHVEIAVSDTGQGIAADFLPHLFERFRQGDATSARQTSGLGLGLAIARHIVEAHGGTIHAESPGPGKGSVFTVKLPLMLIQRTAGESLRRHPTEFPQTTAAYPSLNGLRILAVDDEVDSNEAVRALLTSCGAEVRLAGSAAQAVEILDAWRPDVLLSDIGMPGEDGYAFIARVRAREDSGRHVPAVALTAHASVDDRVRLLAAGFQMHVPKPVEAAELLAVVVNVANRGTGPASGGAAED